MSTQTTDGVLDADELLHLAMRAMDAGDHEVTIGYLKRALAMTPDDGRIHYLLGAIHAELGMRDRAIAELTRATELVPHIETAHFQLGLLHAADGDLERAVAAWRPIEALDAEELLHLALCATRRNEADAALKYVDRALALAPADARLHHLKGGLHAERGEIEAAAAAIGRAVALDPRLWGAHFQLGLLHSTGGRLDEAVRAWAPLDALAESHPLRLFKTGLERLEQGDDDACVALLDAGIAANHESEALNANMRMVIAKVRARK